MSYSAPQGWDVDLETFDLGILGAEMRKDGHGSKNDLSILLIEPNGLLREGLSLILDAAQYDIVLSAASLDENVLASLCCNEPRLLILGGHGDAQDAVRQIAAFKRWSAGGHVVVLVGEEDLAPHIVQAMLEAGAKACLSKITTSEALIKSLEVITLGETIISHQALRALLAGRREAEAPPPALLGVAPAAGFPPAESGAPAPSLSAQEKRILRCVVEGASNKAIARKFAIAEATVKVHLKAILRKIRLTNRTQAAVWALNNRFQFDAEAASDPPRVEVIAAQPPQAGGAPEWRGPHRGPPSLRRVK